MPPVARVRPASCKMRAMDDDSDRLPGGSVREATLTAVRWVFAARAAGEVLRFASSIVMARLIAPAAFGRATIALVLLGIGATMLGGMIGPRLVQRRELPPEYAQAAAFMGIVVGSLLALGTLLAAPPIARALIDEETAALMPLVAPAFLLGGLSVAPQALMQRTLSFRTLGIIEIVATILGALVGSGLAIAGLDEEAIVLGGMAGVVVASGGAIYATSFVRPRWRPAEMRDIARFGVPAGTGSLAAVSYRNVDYPIIGAALGPAALGAYWRAFQLGAEYQRKITVVMLRVAFPVYSRLRDFEELKRMRHRIVRMHATVVLPLLAVLVAVAPELVPLLYGSAWEPAVVPTQILSAGGMIAALWSGLGPLMLATGRSGRLLAFTSSCLALYGATVYLVAPLGLTEVCVAVVAAQALFFVASYPLLLWPLGIGFRTLVPEAGPAAVASGVALLACLGLVALLDSAGAPSGAVVAVAGTLALAVYAAVLRVISPSNWADVRLIVSRVLRRSGEQPAPAPSAGA